MRRLLIIGKNWPEPGSSAAGTRMLQIIHLFLKTEEWEVHFASSAKKSSYSVRLENLGVQSAALYLNDSSAEDFFSQLQPEVVLFDRFMTEEQYGWRVATACPHALRVLDTEDLHFLREARALALKNDSTERAELYNTVTAREIAAILRSDISLVISQAEMEILQNVFEIKALRLFYLPFLMQELKEDVFERYPSFNERKDFLFIGNFKHAPNVDAVRYLKNKIWPKIHSALPEAMIWICGAYPSQEIEEMHNPKGGFQIIGRISDVEERMRNARVLLAPLRFGAGLKGKFFDAMRNGTPSVTTPIGAEGIGTSEEFPGSIAEAPEELIKSAVTLYQDQEQWHTSRQKAYPLIANNFTETSFSTLFFNRIVDLLERLESVRKQNFWQQMMMQHRLQSTKYMSRWIEVKNAIHTKN